MISLHLKKSFFVIVFLAFAFFTPISYSVNNDTISVQTAHATLATEASNTGDWVSNILNGIVQAATRALTSLVEQATNSLVIKEYTLDGIAWALVNTLLQQMIQGITDWVSSGFQGTPAFITDFKGYLMNVGDAVAQDFIEGTPLETLCTPFRLNIQVALSIQYAKTTRYAQRNKQCTISGIVGNVENFINGDFLQGGWDGWFQMTLNPQNNVYGSMLEAETAFKASIGSERDKEVNLLSFGQGLFSTKDEFGDVITPGKTVETGLNHALGLPGDRLALADEIDELIAALLGQLVQTVMGSGIGNLGGGGGGGGGGSTYWDNVATQQSQQGSTNTNTMFTRNDTIWNDYIGVQNTIISMINNAEDYMATRYPNCTTTPGTLTPSLQNQLTAAQNGITSMQTVIDTVNNYEADYQALGSGTTAERDALIAEYGGASAIEAQSNLLNQYNAYISSINPNGYMDYNLSWEATGPTTPMDNLALEITAFTTAIDLACNP